MHEVGEILLEIERSATYEDGMAQVPAFLLEQLHNAVFPDDQQHNYTEAGI